MNYLVTIVSFCFVQVIFNFITFYQAKNIEPTIWNLTIYNLKLLPLLLLANVIITYTFSKGIKSIGSVSVVNLMSWGAVMLVSVLLTVFYIKEPIKGNVLIGLLMTVAGIVISNYK